MALSQQNPPLPPSGPPKLSISQAQSADYIADLLKNLRGMAYSQGQPVLAHLLELAHAAARMEVRDAPPDPDSS